VISAPASIPQLGQVFRAVADPTRRAILDRLRGGPLSVHEIARGFPMSRPAISKHLRILRDAQLVQQHKDGREWYYEFNPVALLELDEWLATYRNTLRLALARLETRGEPTLVKD
jgi:DNA-binding transcriptional ArsR family regulator